MVQRPAYQEALWPTGEFTSLNLTDGLYPIFVLTLHAIPVFPELVLFLLKYTINCMPCSTTNFWLLFVVYVTLTSHVESCSYVFILNASKRNPHYHVQIMSFMFPRETYDIGGHQYYPKITVSHA